MQTSTYIPNRISVFKDYPKFSNYKDKYLNIQKKCQILHLSFENLTRIPFLVCVLYTCYIFISVVDTGSYSVTVSQMHQGEKGEEGEAVSVPDKTSS